jgi:hypothetical protein
MRLKICRVGSMATAMLCVATVVAVPCLAQRNNFQRNNFRPVQGRQVAPNHPPGQGHAGDWLRRY